MKFPNGRTFAFTILDDTDDSTLENVKPVYDYLTTNGLRTTKTVWPVDCPEGSRLFFAADTLQRKEYLDFVHRLACDGFEIAFHGATMESSRRERTLRALEVIRQEFGAYPSLFCNHGHNKDNLYWGRKRFHTGWLSTLVGFMRKEDRSYYSGDVEGSDYFWGDVCRQHIRYVRNFTFACVNVLEADPYMPYHLSGTPYVNQWFSTADAPDAAAFVGLLSDENVERLERAGGVCILSTHLGKGFAKNGKLDPEVERIIQRLGQRPGWYVPASELLDYLAAEQRRGQELGWWKLFRLETRFLLDKLYAARQ